MNGRTLVAWVVPAIIFAVMAIAIQGTAPWAAEGAGLVAGAGQLEPITRGLFHEHVFALEVLGVLLTAAMIGALVIARPLGAAPDEDAYWSDPEHVELEPEMHIPPAVAAPPPPPHTTTYPEDAQ